MSVDGYVIAERMGVEAFVHFAGDDGTAYFLEDGRILKLTACENEPALAAVLLDLQMWEDGHPGVPWIHDVRWFDDEIDVSDILPGAAPRVLRRYAIIRDSFDDLEFDSGDEDWVKALAQLGFGWRHGSFSHIDAALRTWRARGPEIQQVLDGLRWVEDRTGVRLDDLRTSNLGIGPAGIVGMRDLGRGFFPDKVLARIQSIEPVAEVGLGLRF